jgi:integrase
MYSQSTQHKASKGSVQIKSSNNRLQLVFSYAGKRHYLSLGLPDNKLSRKAAEAKAKLIESDIAFDRFERSLAKYKPQSVLSTFTPIPSVSSPSLAELWEQFIEYKRPQCSPNTMRYVYGVFSNYVKSLPTHDLDKATEIRDYCLKNIPLDSCKRFIVRLSACCHWAQKSGWIAENPFFGMSQKIKLPKSQKSKDDIFPFCAMERDAIVAAFETNHFCPKTSKVKHSFYAPLIKFLFATGARPSETIALQWKHISSDFRFISFEQAVITGDKGRRVREGLKTQERRRFPCNNSLQNLLRAIQPKNCDPESLIFPSPEGNTWIDTNNLRNRAWKLILNGLGIKYRKLYQTRHTFITLALENGLDAKDVGRLVGNSPEVIYEHYAGNKRDLFVPEF